MSRIHTLNSQTANMIAAGEVVERPMGVVKELVENSIDADSTRIEISIYQGGMERIIVRDDGCGMDATDATACFGRHATSKISNENDLWSIHSLGFRGEALPSIASVSELTLKTSDGSDAAMVKMSYGKLVSASPYPCSKGTEITVEGLFYQTPARLKHLRSAAYEASLIQSLVCSFALSHPEIAFVLTSDERDAFRTTGQGDLQEVLFLVYGRAVSEGSIPVSFSDYDYKVTGFLVNPLQSRAARSAMHVYLNGRMVRTYRLYKAILDGYEDFIVKGRYPICVLNVEMDPHLLDVNVHPSKWEVRISKENQLEDLLRREVRNALKQTTLAPAANVPEARVEYYEPISFEQELNKPVEETKAPVPEEKPKPAVVQKPIKKEEPIKQPAGFPEMEVIGQLHNKFILCATEDGLAIIDQHAAQERVHFEELCAVLNQQPVMTDCLIPIVLHVGYDIVSRVGELNASVADLHISFEPFGNDTLRVSQVPSWFTDIEEEPFLQDVIDAFRNESNHAYTHFERKRIATMACHHSIRFHRSLTMDEMKEVVRQLSLCENPYHCPHGRPTFITLKEKELTKEFLR